MAELVSIIIPTYNRAYILPNAIHSVLAQTYINWELVIVDDGSTDNTKNIVNGFQNEKILYVSQINAGPSAARNRAFQVARGNWIAYLDSDNELYPEYLERMMASVDQHPDVLFLLPKGKRTLELIENNQVINEIDDSRDFPDKLTLKDIFLRTMHFDINGFMHSRRILDEGLTWDCNLSLMEDWDFVMQIGERHPTNFYYVSEVLFHYHQRFGGDGLVSSGKYIDWANAFEYIYQKHKSDLLMTGQQWYPNRVEKYNNLHIEELKGSAPPAYLKYFS